MSLEDRATELRRFLPDRAVAAILGVDRDELSGYREDPADQIAESGEFRDPRFASMFAGGEYTVTSEDYGTDYAPIYTVDGNNFAQGLGPADEFLLEIYASGDWKTSDEGSDVPANPIGISFALY